MAWHVGRTFERRRRAGRSASATARAARALAWLLALVAPRLWAAPGDTLFYDNLNGNLNDWTIVANGGDASIGNETSNQGRSLRLRWGTVSIYTDPIDAAVPGAELSLWIRRGDDSFSENPEDGEDLLVEYRNSSNAWVELETFPGGGTPGETLTPTYALPADALHSGLRIRLSLLRGTGSDYDYWHVDDVRVTETAGAAGGLGVGSCDDFESGLGNWSIGGTGGEAGLSSATFNSASNALYTRGGPVSVTSGAIDLGAEPGVDLTVWVRRGDDSFSEDPDDGEDLVLEYYTSGGSWSALETFAGNGTPGEIFARSYTLPADALHPGFRLRLRQTGGNGGNYDYWHVDDVCLAASAPVLFSFEEEEWTGGGGEVAESNGNGLAGTAYGGAATDAATPALATNPGTCRYGEFDGVDDYVEIPDDPLLDQSTAVTAAAWIYLRSTPSELYTILSKDWNYEFHIDSQRRVYWWWNDASGAARSLTTGQQIGLDEWHHVAVTYESGSQTIYVDGDVWATASYTGTLRLNDLPLYVGTDWNFIARAFDGYIDEVYVLAKALSQNEVRALRDATHDCATAGAKFTINHDNFGIYCLPEQIAVDVVDATAGTPLPSYDATVELDTQTGRGSWTLVSGGGALVDGVTDDGLATYDWPLGETQAVFALEYSDAGPPVVDVDVFQVGDPGIRDTDAEGNLVFSPNGFILTAGPSSTAPFAETQTAAVPFDVYLTAYGQTPDHPVCGVIESYTGPKALNIWSRYSDPVSGTIPVTIGGAPIAAAEAASTPTNVVFDRGRSTIAAASYKDVGKIAVAVKDETTVNADLPAGIRGGTADFVVRPYDFVLSDIRDAGGGSVNPGANDANGGAFIAAGEPFRATVVAVDADGDATPNYGRETTPETVRLESTLVAPFGGNDPDIEFTTGFDAFSGGGATGYDFVWREVGIVDVTPAVGDGDYLGAGDVVGSAAERIGRFTPDHFALAANGTPLLHTQCGAGGFTYTGAPFDYSNVPVITATAEDVDGYTTANYTGGFQKLRADTLGARSYTSADGTLELLGPPGAALDPSVASAPFSGVVTLTFDGGGGFRFARGSIEAPFDAGIALSVVVADADAIGSPQNPFVFGGAGGIAFDGGAEIRYGRVRFVNAFGSERVDLPVPLRAEYFAGAASGFVANTADSCTSGITLAFGGFTEDLGPAETCALDSGSPGASLVGCAMPAPLAQRFSAPPAAGDFNLTLAAPGVTGSVVVTGNVPDYLKFDWDGAAAGEENPSGQASFGLYGGNARRIYLREVY